jgi:hypothetical protein
MMSLCCRTLFDTTGSGCWALSYNLIFIHIKMPPKKKKNGEGDIAARLAKNGEAMNAAMECILQSAHQLCA